MLDTYQGNRNMEKVIEWSYLGCKISNGGNNQPHVRDIKNKSLGTIKKIFGYLSKMNLGNFYFECSYVFNNSILRPSILYASETLYGLSETEIRQIERIEESYWRQVLKTGRSCPLSEIYLSIGQKPARFEIMRRRILFLKYILDQNENTVISKFFFIQYENQTKGDLVFIMLKDLKYLELNLSF